MNGNEQDQALWAQMQGYGDQLGKIQSQLGSLQGILNSGNVMTANDMGLLTVAGGRNRMGELRPDTVLMRDASGNLDPRFRMSMGQSMQALQDKALTQGDTQSAILARQQQDLMAQQSRDDLQRQGASAMSGAMRNLAMRGGASTGARERIGRDVARGLMSGQQGIGRQNRLANLAISQQDEAMKNQLLGQTGMVEQKIDEANINRLQQDLQAQNIAAQKIYGEDMRALAAEKTASAQRASACFTGNTAFMLSNGSFKMICDITIGDELMEGGIVNFLCQSVSDDMYLYDGHEKVSGNHAVNENGNWIRVKDSSKAVKLPDEYYVYNLGCENHKMLTNKNVFADFFETDHYEELSIDQSLDYLNAKLD